jgi:hypothetical protein
LSWHYLPMLFKLTGSSCAGKTTLARALAGRMPRLAVHDFDEVGVPEHPDSQWRHQTTEAWVRRALEYQDRGIDLLLTGQTPLGEVLATPSSPLLDGIAVCLVDVDDQTRQGRLSERDGGRWDAAAVEAFLGWATWHRQHRHNPQNRPEVITVGGWKNMAWHRWTDWSADDARWHTQLLDTTDQPVAVSADKVAQWVTGQREALQSGHLALRRGWTDEPRPPVIQG